MAAVAGSDDPARRARAARSSGSARSPFWR